MIPENRISERVIGAAIEVHRILGPGLLESLYEDALCHELSLRELRFERQKPVEVEYKGIRIGQNLRLDVLVEGLVIVELKAKETVHPVERAQLLSYLRLTGLRLGLLLNFHTKVLKHGIERIANGLPGE